MRLSRLLLLGPLTLSLACSGPAPAVAEPEVLTIGSTAPPLDVDHWFDLAASAEGEEDAEPLAPITRFEPGKVYLVEFWATWCGPCIMSIPQIKALQEQYREDGLIVVSVSDEDVDTVDAFFDREVARYDGPEEETPVYGDLMSAYRVGADPDGSVNEAYMRAAGQNGIPCAFLVGKSGQIEWIGHPMTLDGPLAEVINDSWDREAFAEKFRLQQQMQIKQQDAMRAASQGDIAGALATLRSMEDLSDDPAFKERARQIVEQFEYSVFVRRLGVDPVDDLERLTSLGKRFADNLPAMNSVAWRVYQAAEAGTPVADEVLQLAADLLEAQLDDGPQRGNALDTLAHLHHAKGDLDRAIEWQRQAIATGESPDQPDLLEAMQGYLEQLLAEQAVEEQATEDQAE